MTGIKTILTHFWQVIRLWIEANFVTFNDLESSISQTIENGNNNAVSSSAVFNYKTNTISKSSNVPIISSSVFNALNTRTHNIPRYYSSTTGEGKDITAYFTDGSLYSRLNGTDGYEFLEDIYVGDFFDMGTTVTITNSEDSVVGSRWVTIAGIDTLAGNGNTIDMLYHHLVLVPGKGGLDENEGSVQHFGQHAMNTSNTTSGGYAGSWMHTTGLPSIDTQLTAIFGDHLKTTKELLSNSIDSNAASAGGAGLTGSANNWDWYNCKSVLMSEVEVFGSTVFSSSGFDVGNAKTQLPLFRFSTKAMNNRSAWYWLKSIASSSDYCSLNYDGFPFNFFASFAGCKIRPRFVIA